MADGSDGWIVVLCADCLAVPITARTKMGVAEKWDGLLLCDACKQRWIDSQQANIQIPSKT